VSGIADASVCNFSFGSRVAFEVSTALFLSMRDYGGRRGGTEGTPTLLTIEEVAAMLNVGPRFVRRLVAKRRIAFHKVGHYVRFDVGDVAAWIAAGRVPTTAGEQRRR
jgi:excisionase family DNA binding protein